MTIINSNLLIDSALNDFIGAGKSPYKQGIANRILDEMNDGIVQDSTDCPKQAIAKAFIRNSLNNRGRDKSDINYFDISFYGFVQTLMDKICWKARRLANNRITETDLDNINGIDFTMEAADQIGIDGSNTASIAEAVQQAYDELTLVSAFIGQKMGSNNDLEPLYMFAPSSPQDDGSWVTDCTITNWDEALTEMNNISEQLAEDEAARQIEDANNINFDVKAA
ncbi:MAG: hypothetical protein ACPHQD_04805 [Vibrio toranzoniae]|uniref:hypothetical protein n=1 Tax=Vibrio toranzoniae TaxID=1194427 RepID=UPI003C47F433